MIKFMKTKRLSLHYLLMILPAMLLLTLACTKAEEAQARKKTPEEKIRIKTGIEVLKEQRFRPLRGKRVGLITNPTGVDNTLRSTIDLLYEAPDVQLVALYGPEHGVRGNQHAGESVTDVRDEATGLPIHSLYGKTRKATPEMVQGLDALVYDIQDIGCRSYTYISSMGLAMEVAAEQDLEFIVLDRPNPLGGWRVEGCLTEDDCVSFVSQFPIPYIYGLTCGELARLLNGERMLSGGKACRLTVVPMKGWRRDMTYADTGLQWIPPSPHRTRSAERPYTEIQRNHGQARRYHPYIAASDRTAGPQRSTVRIQSGTTARPPRSPVKVSVSFSKRFTSFFIFISNAVSAVSSVKYPSQ